LWVAENFRLTMSTGAGALLASLLWLLITWLISGALSDSAEGSCSSPGRGALSLADVEPWAASAAAPRVYIYPHFLTPEECEYLVALAASHHKFVKEKDFNSIYVGWEAIQTDRVIRRIEERIAVVTGIPIHADEEPINIHRYIRTPESQIFHNRTSCGSSGCNRKAKSVHHDKVQKEHSAATVLVYLRDVHEGGGTVWPCRGAGPDGKTPARPCQTAFQHGARWFDGKDTTVKGHMAKIKDPTSVHGELTDILWAAHDACDANSFDGWKNPPVRTEAKAGAAAVFFHNHPNGAPDPWAWHAGCAPLSNDKWTMQKFKEMPMPLRTSP